VIAVLSPSTAMKLPGDVNPADGGDRVVQALQDDRVLYSNQPVAVAIADTFERALHAAGLVRVRVEPAPSPCGSKTSCMPPSRTARAASRRTTSAATSTRRFAGRTQAGSRVRDPPEIHSPLEPHATLAVWNGDRLTVYDATQGIFGVRKKLARAFAVPPGNVRVITKFVGGGSAARGRPGRTC